MYNEVYFSRVTRRPVTKNQNNNYAETPIERPQYKQFKEISPAVNDAIYSYASPAIQKPYEKMSLNDNILRLKKEGKREGIDYRIEGSEIGNIVLYINNKSGQPLKVLHYDGGDINHVNVYETYKYQNGRETKYCGYDYKNDLNYYTNTYYNDENSQKNFTTEGITAYTKADEYIEYLKNNNIKFKVEPKIYGDNQKTLEITEYDDRNRKSQFTGFELNGENRVMRELYGFDGSRERIEFDENATYITEYFK